VSGQRSHPDALRARAKALECRTPIEYRVLTTLIRHAGKVLTHQQLLKEVWGRPGTDQPHYPHVFMAQLRRKIEHDPARPRHLLTDPGVGHRLAAD
jgi:two-component system, OmpR family, KDP operon response regulator KdpE